MTAHSPDPTPRQLRYLRQLAEQTGTTFTPPRTRAEASRETERLRQRSRSAGFERGQDREAISRGLAEQQPASTVRDDEIRGYGGHARWARG